MRWFSALALVAALPLVMPTAAGAQPTPANRSEWLQAVHRLVTARSTYPGAASFLSESGTVVIELEVERDGTLDDVDIVEEAEAKVLNDAALAAFKGVTFSPFPPDMTQNDITLKVPLAFVAPQPTARWRAMAGLLLQNARVTPVDASHYQVAGEVLVRVVAGRRGAFNASVLKSSGHKVLDDAALAAVKSVQLPPFPREMTEEEVTLDVAFGFAPPVTEADWMSAVADLIQARNRYPDTARPGRLAGIVELSFRPRRDDTIEGARVERGRDDILDAAALAIFDGLRLPPMPPGMEDEPGRLYTSAYFGLPSTEKEWDELTDKWVEHRARYPKEASSRSIEGTVEVILVADWTGRVLLVELLGSSGKPVLDEAALALYRTTRLPPFAPDMDDLVQVGIYSMTYDIRTRRGIPF